MITIELLYKFGFNSNVDINMNIDKELEEFISFVKIIQTPEVKFEVYQSAVLKSYSVYRNISIYLKNLELNLDEVINEKSNYNVYSVLLMKVGFFYSSIIKLYVEEILTQANSIQSEALNSLKNTFKYFLNPE